MRTILSLALILGISGGVTLLTGCDKGKGTSSTTKTEKVDKGPAGAETKTKTETESSTTPPKEEKK